MRLDSDDIICFDDDEYIGAEVSFPNDSVWKLVSKTKERGYSESQGDCEALCLSSEARGIFLCSKVSGHDPATAIVKIRLQIPWYRTAGKKNPQARAKQAIPEIPHSCRSEIKALSCLTEARCSSAPSLLSWKAETQTCDEWVPGGYKLSILMEHLPGFDPSDLFLSQEMPRVERDRLRSAFKAAWLETVGCGVVHEDDAIDNLLWDRESNRCYLVDWELWHPADEKTVWHDHLYIGWNLAREGPSHNLFDMADCYL